MYESRKPLDQIVREQFQFLNQVLRVVQLELFQNVL